MSIATRLFHSRSALLYFIWILSFFLVSTISNAYAAQATLTWQDPNNNPAEVGGYNLYYWQTNWDIPASVDVGNADHLYPHRPGGRANLSLCCDGIRRERWERKRLLESGE